MTKKSPLGLTAVTKTYNHGALATKKPADSDTVALAYDEALNLVKTMTVQTDPPQVVASNTYSHNETLVNSDEGSHYAYDYDGFGRVTSIKIDGEAYCTIEYTNQNQKVTKFIRRLKQLSDYRKASYQVFFLRQKILLS
ncbi:MAG: hypothetical protein ACI4M6_01225 [Christensenellaceae bacterium]